MPTIASFILVSVRISGPGVIDHSVGITMLSLSHHSIKADVTHNLYHLQSVHISPETVVMSIPSGYNIIYRGNPFQCVGILPSSALIIFSGLLIVFSSVIHAASTLLTVCFIVLLFYWLYHIIVLKSTLPTDCVHPALVLLTPPATFITLPAPIPISLGLV